MSFGIFFKLKLDYKIIRMFVFPLVGSLRAFLCSIISMPLSVNMGVIQFLKNTAHTPHSGPVSCSGQLVDGKHVVDRSTWLDNLVQPVIPLCSSPQVFQQTWLSFGTMAMCQVGENYVRGTTSLAMKNEMLNFIICDDTWHKNGFLTVQAYYNTPVCFSRVLGTYTWWRKRAAFFINLTKKRRKQRNVNGNV